MDFVTCDPAEKKNTFFSLQKSLFVFSPGKDKRLSAFKALPPLPSFLLLCVWMNK